MANIYHPSFTTELSNASEFSSVEKVNQLCDILHTILDNHAALSLWKVIQNNSSQWFESIKDELFKAERK